jgi:hypothetical protein
MLSAFQLNGGNPMAQQWLIRLHWIADKLRPPQLRILRIFARTLAMPQILRRPLPTHALLTKYANSGAYTDCFTTDIARTVSHVELVEAFYTGRLFKLERLLIRVFLSRLSTDLDARRLASGELNDFSAWRVESREVDQLLLCPMDGRTRSWLMVSPSDVPGHTRLYFGSALLPSVAPNSVSTGEGAGKRRMGFVFSALLGFHNLYSRALLAAAAARLERG